MAMTAKERKKARRNAKRKLKRDEMLVDYALGLAQPPKAKRPSPMKRTRKGRAQAKAHRSCDVKGYDLKM